MDYKEKFLSKLEEIKNPIIKQIGHEGIELLPEYFWNIPASSTGKYHPNYALGQGGLLRHVLAAVEIAEMLFEIYSFTDDEKDGIIISLLFHDGWKHGKSPASQYVLHAHPVIASKTLQENISVEYNSEKELYLGIICNNIASHMGKWNTNRRDPVVLPLPQTETEKFVHLCDYIASRKPLEYNFST